MEGLNSSTYTNHYNSDHIQKISLHELVTYSKIFELRVELN